LRAHGERQWAFRLEGDLEVIRDGDAAGVDHLLSADGGMGSLNDLWLCLENGHKITAAETSRVNERLSQYRERMWHLAREARRQRSV
jgi:hypothetical protein